MTQVQDVQQLVLPVTHEICQTRPAPFLKWVGGKTQLLKQFERFFPATFHTYYEPFIGSGAVFFHLQPAQAVISDYNPNLIAAYRHLQSQVDDLLDLLYRLRTAYHVMSPQEQEHEYYRVRECYNVLSAGSLEKTAYLIFLNKTGYNGLYRESKRGGYNVPFGRYNNPSLFDEMNLKAISRTLQHTEIFHADFSATVETAKAGDFVYFDPPYVPLNETSSFTSYTRGEFPLEQQVRLAEVVRQLASKGVQVMISNSNTDIIRELYQDRYIHEVKASRAVNSKAALRGKITELVVTTYQVEQPLELE